MIARSLMIAVTLLSSASIASAQPGPSAATPANPPANRPAQVTLASAERLPDAENPAPEAQPASTPAKRPRAARVTTCRCGDPGQ